jgi:hypothetical protein
LETPWFALGNLPVKYEKLGPLKYMFFPLYRAEGTKCEKYWLKLHLELSKTPTVAVP